MSSSIRQRLIQSLKGNVVEWPVYAVYDWFVKNRNINWQSLFDKGLGQINHVKLVKVSQPSVEIIETTECVNGRIIRNIKWITDIGELQEQYIDKWHKEYLIKKPEDFRIMCRALTNVTFQAAPEYFEKSDKDLGEKGITLGQLGRTPLQKIQIDYTGLETFSIHLAEECPELMELLELMNELKLKELKTAIATSNVRYIKLWENLTIETMGPIRYRNYLIPFYQRMFECIKRTDKKLIVHYDGKLKAIAHDIRQLSFDGIDSLTPPPEGDMTIAESRAIWPHKFLWLHPCLGWFTGSKNELITNIKQMINDAGTKRFCLLISEEVPHNWEHTIPTVLKVLENI